VRAVPTREEYQSAPPLQPADDIVAAPETVHVGEIERPAPRPQTRYPDAVTIEESDGDTAVIEARLVEMPRVEARPVEAPRVETPRVEVKAAAVQAVQADIVEEPWAAPHAAPRFNDSLAPMMALSADERIALFT